MSEIKNSSEQPKIIRQFSINFTNKNCPGILCKHTDTYSLWSDGRVSIKREVVDEEYLRWHPTEREPRTFFIDDPTGIDWEEKSVIINGKKIKATIPPPSR